MNLFDKNIAIQKWLQNHPKPNHQKQTLPKDPVTLDSDQVDVVETVSPSYPDRPAKMNMKQYGKYYKKRAHYYQKRHEGAKNTLGDCSDIF